MIKVTSSQGTFTTDMRGNVLVAELTKPLPEDCHYLRIIQFDFAEYFRTWGEFIHESVDILNLGYWYKGKVVGEGTYYEKPEEGWREDLVTLRKENPPSNIKMTYMHRDSGNYKETVEVVLLNKWFQSLNYIEEIMRYHMHSTEFFYPEKLGLPKAKACAEGEWHELVSIEFTEEGLTLVEIEGKGEPKSCTILEVLQAQVWMR